MKDYSKNSYRQDEAVRQRVRQAWAPYVERFGRRRRGLPGEAGGRRPGAGARDGAGEGATCGPVTLVDEATGRVVVGAEDIALDAGSGLAVISAHDRLSGTT